MVIEVERSFISFITFITFMNIITNYLTIRGMKRVFYLTLGLLVMTLGCQTNPELTDQEKESIVKAVKERSQLFWVTNNQSYNSESMQKFMSLIDENCDQAWQTDPAMAVFNIGIIKFRTEVESFWKTAIESRNSTNVTIVEDYFAVLSKDKVLEVNKGDYTVAGKDSITYGPFSMVNTIVWVNKNGEWKMLHCHESYVAKEEK